MLSLRRRSASAAFAFPPAAPLARARPPCAPPAPSGSSGTACSRLLGPAEPCPGLRGPPGSAPERPRGGQARPDFSRSRAASASGPLVGQHGRPPRWTSPPPHSCRALARAARSSRARCLHLLGLDARARCERPGQTRPVSPSPRAPPSLAREQEVTGGGGGGKRRCCGC
ncbi:hypothetical protein I4F81_006203 [Pyropia yezoensis]|uniref:Uncharacterized protein n=1 Tax=Pyropia yezoensis TaxID=2788 RepID=A0ACC3C135_PYRYE|nr:hypothetical protein I4F81_006203 [Neopyropia yezoensis]